MMPKVTMKAPAGVGGQIHASASGKNYTIDTDGTVVVDSVDVAALMTAGYQTVPHDGGPDTETAAPISSVAPLSTTTGATATDPDVREVAHREVEVSDGQMNQDHGDAIPPHGEPTAGTSDPVVAQAKQAEAQAEVDQAALSGVNTAHVSAQADTGDMSTVTASAKDQAEVRAEPDAPAK